MKIRKISILTAFLFGAAVAFTGCKKDDGAVPSRVTIAAVPVVSTNVETSGSQAIDLLNLSTFSGKFKVDLYFPGGVAPDKVDIVVRKNGTSNVKVFKTGISTFPAIFTITAAELATLFGGPIVLNDTYDFAPDMYVGEKKYEAFPVTGIGTGAGVAGMPLYSEFARFGAICAYPSDMYQGNFVVVSDAWQDFAPGDIIVLTKLSATTFSFKTPYGVGQTPVVVTVNPGNNQVTIPKSSVGSAWTYYVGTYTGAYIATAGAVTSSFVSPCSQTVTMNLNYMVDAGTFGGGPYPLILKKQ